jgi:hypothetical protein
MKSCCVGALSVLAAMLVPKTLHAAVVFAQTPPHAAAFASDSDNTFFNRGLADDFSLADSAVVHSVAWRGIIFSTNNPILPLQFTLAIFGDAGGKPDANDVISSSAVTFTSLSQFPIAEFTGNSNVYEFSADIPAASLSANTRYWFSPYANTSNDPRADWYWVSGHLTELSAERNAIDAWLASNQGPFYFTLAGTPLPEPASCLTFCGGICYSLTSRRRNLRRPQWNATTS